ncbi:MAG: LacI family transcriptional regulator [Lachnospiraceae bacterium]|nr:LacI family transcriptional regulator [Lachnospiraceae bacterium]
MVTLKDVAEKCNVTTATVSNIINGKSKASAETRERVLDTIKELGYQPNVIARGLRGKKTGTIGIIVEDITLFDAPKIIVSIMNYCAETGYHAVIENMRYYMRTEIATSMDEKLKYKKDVADAVAKMRAMRADGLIFLACHARKNIDVLPPDLDFPVVMVYSYIDNPEIPVYVLDDENCSYNAVKYLIDNGHRKIGIIAGANDNLHAQKRIISYQKALFDAGIPFDPELVYADKWSRKCGYDGLKKFVSMGVTAVYCLNDEMAGGAYDYAREAGLEIPKDISVVGHDNREIADYFNPKLTTIDLPLYELGFRAARRIVAMIEGKPPVEGDQTVLQCTFIPRESVKKI